MWVRGWVGCRSSGDRTDGPTLPLFPTFDLHHSEPRVSRSDIPGHRIERRSWARAIDDLPHFRGRRDIPAEITRQRIMGLLDSGLREILGVEEEHIVAVECEGHMTRRVS